MKKQWAALWMTTALISHPLGALAAEYQGQNIDGQTFEATAYSYETGGLFEIQVRFKKRRATMFFASGGRQTIRLNQPIITNPTHIEGWGWGFLTIAGLLSIGVADNSDNNLQPPHPRPLEGFWRISLKEGEIPELRP
jgi:hypothetical protein